MNYEDIQKQLDAEYGRIINETLRRLAKKTPLTRQIIAQALMAAEKRYWTYRLSLLDNTALVEAERVARAIAIPYAHAAQELADQVRRVYAGYQSAFNLTQKDADELLNHVRYDRSIADNLRTMTAALPEGEEKTRIMAEISAPAYRYRIQRAEAIAKDAQETLQNIAKNEIKTDRALLQTAVEKEYNIALGEAAKLPPSEAIIVELTGQTPKSSGYMPRAEEAINEFTPTTDRGILDSFSLTNTKAVKEIINRDWKGDNFSDRIWSDTDALAREVKEALLQGELTGFSEAKIAEKIQERFQVSMYKARRVVRTEHNYCVNQAHKQGLIDAGYDSYKFASLHEARDCDTCDDLDGEEFKFSDAAIGVNFPPIHPFCRCRITAPGDMPTVESINEEIDRMLNGMSLDELNDRLEALAMERGLLE